MLSKDLNYASGRSWLTREVVLEIKNYQLVIIGAGPAGLAPLLAAHRNGLLDYLLSQGVAIVEASAELGGGCIGRYAINSDSTASTFIDCLRGPKASDLTALQSHPLTREVASAGDGPVPLQLAGRFLSLVGQTLSTMVAAHPACSVFANHRALHTQRTTEGWTTTIKDPFDLPRTIKSRFVLVATGAHQPLVRLAAETVGDVRLLERYEPKLMQSGDVFVSGGLEAVAERLADLAEPRVAVVGGSTSAAAVANALLQRLPSIPFGAGGVTLLHRRPLRIYYPSMQEALDDGYTEFTEDDICSISGRVFRLAGFRLDSRELIMRARGIGGRPAEPRLVLHQLRPHDPQAMAILDRADLVVAALGYRPLALSVLDMDGTPVGLHVQIDASAPMVDGACRVIDSERRPISGLLGIGLAAGFVPRGKLGGELSFSGQANGLWLWQNDVGMLIVEAVIADLPSPISLATAAFALNAETVS